MFLQAKTESRLQHRRMLDVLQEITDLGQEPFLYQLSQTLGFNAISMKELNALRVNFEVISFSNAQQKECLAFDVLGTDSAHSLIVVFADPFNDSLQEWVMEHIKHPFARRLAHKNDIAAFLARHEETMRAMDGLASHADAEHLDSDQVVASLSLKSINEDKNPIIKLINSTLYDALKVGASDIHLECSNTGLAIKYRIDGVMTDIGGMQGIG